MVRITIRKIAIPTYEPAKPDRNPMFLEKRVYQGSSGRVYPLPFIDRIAEEPTERDWNAVVIENEFVSLTLLPELGGRIHFGQDLTNGFDFFYRQNVIKPALVGLAGPWISGGVEFNWPQHHRPSTFMPTDVSIEKEEDGSVTVWMSEHEPMNRMKGMHGVCLHPGRNVIELKVRLYNRTPFVQTFLWWANMATRVHEAYKSFFPPDVHSVADHAKRAMSSYPLCDDHYYGVDFGTRGRLGVPPEEAPADFVPAALGGAGPVYAPNDLSWYANIPVPTSYMCIGTDKDFFGGYDAFAEAGLMHIADHHVSPGKKQWTWGNHEFGYAWDRNLTDSDGPYIELMAGVYTDNQPDFSYLAPGETKTFSQFWYPYRQIGPAQFANLDAALSVIPIETGARVGVAVTKPLNRATVTVSCGADSGQSWEVDLSPENPFVAEVESNAPILLSLTDSKGRELARYDSSPSPRTAGIAAATEPPMPEDVATSDELFLVGLHLEQYRHATRNPALYWEEALRRDPGDTRCNNALGLWRLKRGEFEVAEERFRAAVERSTSRNPNPYDGEPYYNLGLTLRFQGRLNDAYDAFAKSAWNSAWQSAAYHAMAEIDCQRENWKTALADLERSLKKDSENFRAANLKAIVLRILDRSEEANQVLRQTLQNDRLDFWTLHLLDAEPIQCDNGVRLDLAIDSARAGFFGEALDILEGADHTAGDGTAPMLFYYQAFYRSKLGEDPTDDYRSAETASMDYCFPSRLEDLIILSQAIQDRPNDARARFYLGNLLYDRRRHREAIAQWQESARLDTSNSICHRNLGIGSFNVLGNPEAALAAYDAAVKVAPYDDRVLYERDQLCKRIGISPEKRLADLTSRLDLVNRRDSLIIEYCILLNDLGRPEEAEAILASRKFQPWEGGEGMALGIFSRTQLALAIKDLSQGRPGRAKERIESTLNPPRNLGEARHLLANCSDLWLTIGDACAALGELNLANTYWTRAAEFKGDFQEMSVMAFSELSYFQAVALQRLGRIDDATSMFEQLAGYAHRLGNSKAKIDYFATSLPTMLLFDDDLQVRLENTARFIAAQAALGLGKISEARKLLDHVLRVDPNHALAKEFQYRLASSSDLAGVPA